MAAIVQIPANALVTATGATPGAFAVGPSGAATYTVPIVVAPGIRGVQPSLSLTYNSQGGDGFVGIGWGLAGLSVVHRCSGTFEIDGFKGGVNYDGSDRLCLDGERLVPIGGDQYRTLRESLQKVTLTGPATNPSSFTVKDKDGTVREYAQAIQVAGNAGTNRLWALSKIRDISGNYLTITYDTSDVATSGDYRPSRIDYTANDGQGVTPQASVAFDYTPRTSVGASITPLYEGGSIVKSLKLLTRITSAADGATVRTYQLGYDAAGAGGRARLANITECGTDGTCFPATQFGWQTGGQGFGGAIATGAALSLSSQSNQGHGPWLVDINGDGKADLLQSVLVSGGGYAPDYYNAAYALGTGSGFNATAQVTAQMQTPPVPGDINGDGRTDIAWIANTPDGWGGLIWSIKYAFGTSSGFGAPVNGPVITVSSDGYSGYLIPKIALVDLNGDGRADLLRWQGDASTGFGNAIDYAFSTGAGFAAFAQWNTSPYATGFTARGPWFADVNGDGRTDLLWINNNNGVVTLAYAPGSNSGFGAPVVTGSNPGTNISPQFADLNGDSKADMVWLAISGSSAYVAYAFSTGAGYTAPVTTGFDLASASGMWPVDVNGDGKADLAWLSGNTVSYALGTGNGFSTGVGTNVSVSNGTSMLAGDINGDGKADLVWSSLYPLHVSFALANPAVPDLLSTVTNGLGVVTSVTYRPLADSSVYTKDTNATYPYVDVQNGGYVVASVASSNGVGGSNTMLYQYGGLKSHITAGVSLGFRWTQITDPAGLINVTYFNQSRESGIDGTIATEDTYHPNGVLVKHVANTWAPSAAAVCGGTRQPQLQSSIQQMRDPSPAGSGNVFMQVNTTNTYDACGFPQTIVIDYSDGWHKTTNNTYSNDTASWILGRLTQGQVTAEAPGQNPKTRTSAFTYRADGFMATEVIEPNNAALTLATSYGYDAFGNRTSKEISGPGIATRTEYAEYGTQYQGRFLTKKTNALGQATSYNYDSRSGQPSSQTDPNGLVAQWDYDGLGRKKLEIRPDGTSSTIVYDSGCANFAGGGAYAMLVQTDGTAPVCTYFDILGRVVLKATVGFGDTNGDKQIYVGTGYDSLGRVAFKSHPEFGAPSTHGTSYEYDLLNRVTRVTEPGPQSRVTTTAYDGLTTVVTNPLGQSMTTVKNSQGKAVQVTDAVGGITAYTYGPFGNVLSVTDAVGNVATMTYDDRGRKIAMHDPDMGNWSYSYDVLDQLMSQTDAKGQVTTMSYDVLGRMTSRTTLEGPSIWTYDTAAHGVGKLATVSGPDGYQEFYSYDAVSRLIQTTVGIAGTNYTVGRGYDQFSRPTTITYPGAGYTIKQEYDPFGNLWMVKRLQGATESLVWMTNEADAHARVTEEFYGNNVVTRRTYDHETGDLKFIQSGAGGSTTSIQNLSYGYDALHNLKNRNDTITGVNEGFNYDNLNRLVEATGPAPKSYQYDAIGNITYKSDVGTYTYPASGPTSVRPHAVTSVAGPVNATYTYDANGNMLTADGAGTGGGGSGGGSGGTLSSGVTVAGLAGTAGEDLRYTFTVPAGASNLSFQLYGGTGDADLYVRYGSPPTLADYDCRPYIEGNDEICGMSAQAGTWYVLVNAYADFSGATLVATYTTGSQGTTLSNNVPLTGLTAPAGQPLHFTLDVPAGASNLTFQTAGGTGDADLYVKYGTAPTTASYDCRPYEDGNDETCAMPNAQAGTWHVMIDPYEDFAGLTLVARYSTPTGGTPSISRTITYTSFNKPQSITGANGTTAFAYDANHQRIQKVTSTATTIYVGKLYERVTTGGLTEEKNYVYAGGSLVAIYTSRNNNVNDTQYVHTDHLGSVNVLTDENGSILERLAYDPHGKRRLTSGQDATTLTSSSTRGFTGHAMDDEAGLINMNARLYDPRLGRFITPDTMVDGAAGQGLNRYSYCANNPLSRIDPSGHRSLRKTIRKLARIAISITVGFYTGLYFNSNFLGGAVGGWLATGNRQGLIGGGIAGATFGWVGNVTKGADFALKGFVHGVAGGFLNRAAGGDFGAGFFSGSFASIAGGEVPKSGNLPLDTTVRGIIGGLAAEIGGGEFGNGALTGAYGYLFSEGILSKLSRGRIDLEYRIEYQGEEWQMSGSLSGEVVPLSKEDIGNAYIMKGVGEVTEVDGKTVVVLSDTQGLRVDQVSASEWKVSPSTTLKEGQVEYRINMNLGNESTSQHWTGNIKTYMQELGFIWTGR